MQPRYVKWLTLEQISQFTYLGCSISYQFYNDVEFKLAKLLLLIGTIKRIVFKKVGTETILKIYLMQFRLGHILQQNPSPIRPLQGHWEFQLRHGRIIMGAEKTEVAPFPIQHQQMFITNQTVAWWYLLQRGEQRRFGSRQNIRVPYLRQEILVLPPEPGYVSYPWLVWFIDHQPSENKFRMRMFWVRRRRSAAQRIHYGLDGPGFESR